MDSYVLKTTNACKSFGKIEILHDIDLSIERGEVYGLIGQNGAGKTTLLRLISGLMKPTKGTVQLDAGKSFIGYMPQSCRFDDGNTARATINMFAKLRGGNLLESLALGEKLHLDLTKKVKHLSPGQQKKLQMIIAMTGDPDLYILDEPTAGLDPSATFEMKNIIKDLNKKGKSILISSHILQDMDEICTNVAIMEKGRLTYDNKLTSSYIFETSPIAKEVLLTLGKTYSISSDSAGTSLTVQIEKEQVPELIYSLNNFHVRIYEVAASNVKNLVQHKLNIGEEAQRI